LSNSHSNVIRGGIIDLRRGRPAGSAITVADSDMNEVVALESWNRIGLINAHGNTFSGISLVFTNLTAEGSPSTTVVNSQLEALDTSIELLLGSNNSIIRNNQITNGNVGVFYGAITISGSNGVIIEDNTMERNNVAVGIDRGSNIIVRNNTIRFCTERASDAVVFNAGTNNQLLDNVITNNEGGGAVMYGIGHIIRGNDFRNNGRASNLRCEDEENEGNVCEGNVE
jgi:parallel beta-helix repeat protein